jgi:DNA helicase-2/ATP-dependent DNA helicase PcrA
MASRFLKAIPLATVRQERTSSMFSAGRYGGTAGGRYERARSAGPAWDSGYTNFHDEDIPPSRRSAPSGQAVPPEDVSQDAPRYVRGERVKHRRFGSGTIKGLLGAGRDLKVEVVFDDAEAGTKQLLVAYAGLERDWESA